MNKSTENTIKLFDVDENLTSFLESSQAKFWEDAKAPFKRLSVEECKKEIPIMGKFLQFKIEVAFNSLPGVNFINILEEPFLNESALHSFSLITARLCKFFGKRISVQKHKKY